eukprot:322118-Pelagomonas_calceolata.AAC.6
MALVDSPHTSDARARAHTHTTHTHTLTQARKDTCEHDWSAVSEVPTLAPFFLADLSTPSVQIQHPPADSLGKSSDPAVGAGSTGHTTASPGRTAEARTAVCTRRQRLLDDQHYGFARPAKKLKLCKVKSTEADQVLYTVPTPAIAQARNVMLFMATSSSSPLSLQN